MIAGLEQNVVALLGSRSSQALLRVMPPADLALACVALVMALRGGVPAHTPLLSRVSDIVAHVLSTTALNTVLVGATVPGDAALTCANLLGVFFLSSVLAPSGSMSDTAQYLLVYNLSAALQGFREAGLALAWALAFAPTHAPWMPGRDVVALAQLVTVETLSSWLRAWLPPGLLLPTTLVLLYLCAPFVPYFPPLRRLYRFAVFAVSNDRQIRFVPSWLMAVALWGLGRADPDPVGRAFAAMAGASVAVVVVLDAMQFAMDKDPGATLMAVLVAIRILETGSKKTTGPIRAELAGAP
jgi:hypothetical protein